MSTGETVGAGRLFIVEDERLLRRVLRIQLQQRGHEVGEAARGDEAPEQIRAFRPDVVLLDVNLPGMDGFDVCRALQAHEDTRSIPVIFLTSKAAVEDRVAGLGLGAVDYVPKPFNFEELAARVEASLRTARKLQAAQAEASEARGLLQGVRQALDQTIGQTLLRTRRYRVALLLALAAATALGGLWLSVREALRARDLREQREATEREGRIAAHLEQGRRLAAQQRLSEAALQFDAALAIDPAHPVAIDAAVDLFLAQADTAVRSQDHALAYGYLFLAERLRRLRRQTAVDAAQAEKLRGLWAVVRGDGRLSLGTWPEVQEAALWRLERELSTPVWRGALGADPLALPMGVYELRLRLASGREWVDSFRLGRGEHKRLAYELPAGAGAPEGMVWIPPGVVDLPELGGPRELAGFYVDRQEVSVGQYAQFVKATGQAPPPDWAEHLAADPKLPARQVSLADARAYAAWTSKALPDEAQWLRAALGADARPFPWGWEQPAGRAQVGTEGRLRPVDELADGASIFGVLNLVGNVSEWTADQALPGRQVVRGASARTVPDACHLGYRVAYPQEFRSDDLGFRCVRPAAP